MEILVITRELARDRDAPRSPNIISDREFYPTIADALDRADKLLMKEDERLKKTPRKPPVFLSLVIWHENEEAMDFPTVRRLAGEIRD